MDTHMIFLFGGILIGLTLKFQLIILYKISEWLYYNVYVRFMVRVGWYQYRAKQGHPISWSRALFSDYPRFSCYEKDEVGCPDWALKDYQNVQIRIAQSVTRST